MLAMNSYDPFVLGLAFLEVEPTQYLCSGDSGGSPENNGPGPDEWYPCTKEEICSKGYPREKYKPDPNDPEYIDNWVWRYDTLCKPKSRLGFFALYFFVGIMTTILIFPKISDMYGRREIFITTMIVTFIA